MALIKTNNGASKDFFYAVQNSLGASLQYKNTTKVRYVWKTINYKMNLVMCLIIIKILNETHGKSIFETTSTIQSNSEEFIMTNSTEEYSKKVLNNLLVAFRFRNMYGLFWSTRKKFWQFKFSRPLVLNDMLLRIMRNRP